MPPTLKEILADKAKYQDGISWQLENGVSLTLGQLRQMSAEDQSALSKREKDIEAARGALALEEKKLKDGQIQTANVYQTLNSAMEAIKSGRLNDPAVTSLFGNGGVPGVGPTGPTDPFAELSRLEGDTLLGPVVKLLKVVNDRAQKAEQAVANNIKVQQTMATHYLNGTLEDRYDRIVPADKQDKITLELLIRDAVNHNEMRSDSTPDIRKAYLRATEHETQAVRDAKIAADAIAKYKADNPDSNNAINVPPSSSFYGLDVHNRSGAAPQPFKNLDEAFAAAGKDPDIWRQVDGQTN
jgi:hypothetical protein